MSESVGVVRCTACGASAPLPPDLAVLTANCPYCGTTLVLPDQDTRRVAQERMKDREFQARIASDQRQEREKNQKRTRNMVLVGVGIALVLLLGAGLGIALLVAKVNEADAPIDPAKAGLAKMSAHIDERAKTGCTHVVDAPQMVVGKKTGVYELTNAICFDVLAVTGTPGQTLTIALVGPNGKALDGAPPPGADVSFLACPKLPGQYQLTVTSTAPTTPFTVAGVDCPKPSLDDPHVNGQARVSAMMKERFAAGCREVTMPPRTVSSDQDFTGDFHPGSCVLVLGATGVSKNLLTVDLTTPFGEKVPVPAPATEVSFLFCPKVAGRHEGHVRAQEEAPFTLAAVTCPLSMAKGK